MFCCADLKLTNPVDPLRGKNDMPKLSEQKLFKVKRFWGAYRSESKIRSTLMRLYLVTFIIYGDELFRRGLRISMALATTTIFLYGWAGLVGWITVRRAVTVSGCSRYSLFAQEQSWKLLFKSGGLMITSSAI